MAMNSTSNSNQCTGLRWPKVTIKSEHSNWKIDFFFSKIDLVDFRNLSFNSKLKVDF